MSEENHPNIHVVGFACDILESYLVRLRGEARQCFESDSGRAHILSCLTLELSDFVAKVETRLDTYLR